MLNKIIHNKKGELNKIFFVILLISIISLGIIASQENSTENNAENTQPLEQNETSAQTESELSQEVQPTAEVSSENNSELSENLTIEKSENTTEENTTEDSILTEKNETNTITSETIQEIQKPVLTVELNYNSKITRGETFEAIAVISNIGKGDANDVIAIWEIPDGFEIINGEKESSIKKIIAENMIFLLSWAHFYLFRLS